MKNRKALYLLLGANAVSQFAQGITMLAIPWYFIDILGKASLFGWIYAGTTFVTLFWSLYAGTIVDRYPRKNVFLTLNIVGCLFQGGLAATGFFEGELGEALVASAFCFTMFIYVVHYPSVYAFGQEITEPKHYARTNSLIEIQGQATAMIGGAVAAILLGGIRPETLAYFNLDGVVQAIEPWHIHEIFLMDAITYALAIGFIAFIRYMPLRNLKIDTGSIVERLKVGFRFLKNNVPLFIFGNFSFSIFVVILVHGFLLLPMYVDNHLGEGAEIFALSEVMYSFGAMSAGFLTARIFRRTNYIKGVIYLMIITTLVFYWAAFTNSILVFCIFNLALGVCNAGSRIMRVTYMFNHIPNNVIGRSTSVFRMINITIRFIFIGLFSIPFFAEENNVIWSFVICGAFVALSIIPLITNYRTLIEMKPLSDESS